MANTKRDLFLKRRLRVRNKIKAMANGRARLSVHRSNKNISVQLIDDVKGMTVASASSLEKDLGVVGKNNVEAAAKIGFPVVVRPSYVLGGRGMAIVYDMGTLDRYMTNAVDASPRIRPSTHAAAACSRNS